jgi:hypothetical protein
MSSRETCSITLCCEPSGQLWGFTSTLVAPALADADGEQLPLHGTPRRREPATRASSSLAASAHATDALSVAELETELARDGRGRRLRLPAFTYTGAVPGGRDSLRVLATWFPKGRSLVLAAERKKGHSHDRDAIAVVGTGEPQPLYLEPRLSGTYGGDGALRNFGLELWLTEDGDDDSDEYLRRWFGVATGARLQTVGDTHALRACALRCTNSRGDQGVGVFALLEPRPVA